VKPHRLRNLLRLPNGRLLWTPDRGSSLRPADMFFQSHLEAELIRKDGATKHYDLGSGLVTNVGVNMLANDPTWVAAGTPFSTLSSMLYVSTGTGATADAAGDYWLQTQGTHFSGGTNNYYTGTISLVAPNIWKNVATVTYNGTETVTEWVLVMSNAANFSRTSAGAAPTQTTFTDTGATFTTSGNGLKGWTIEIASSAVNTPTTTAQALVTSNSATVLTLAPGPDSTHWWSLANASVAAPGATVAYVVYPTAFDHKHFTGIGVNSGDSIQFTYQLTINSGG
jgi:hypothetical protein